MKKVKQLKGWGIYELSQREWEINDFKFAVIHPDVMGCGNVTARDTDIECFSLNEAINWIKNY